MTPPARGGEPARQRGALQKTINHLIQLQELTWARAQQAASMPNARLEALDENIRTLSGELPEPFRTQFARLQKRDLIALVPVAHGSCSACGMKLPVSLENAVKVGDRLYPCPACARLMYWPEVKFRGIGRRVMRGEPPKTGLERFSSPPLMVPDLEGATGEDVVTELCHVLEDHGFVENGLLIAREAMKREAVCSTAVGGGVAFPHVRGVEGGGLTLAVGIHHKGVRFGAPSRQLTRLFFFMVIPTAASSFYLSLLAGLSQTLANKEKRDKVLACNTSAELWKTLMRMTRATIK